jgi:hypothetical protein
VIHRIPAVFTLFLFLPTLPSLGQISIRYFPSHPPADGSILQACLDEGSVLQTELKRFPHPSKWTFIVACDAASWAAVERHVDWSNVPGKVLGLTDIDHGLTYLRGDTLVRPVNGSTEASAEHVIAHELAHIYLHSSDERRVEDKALDWIRTDHKEAQAATLLQTAGEQ